MHKSFLQNQILAFFKLWNETGPLDLALGDFFRARKYLGSHDRRTIGDSIYALVRWQSLFDHFDPGKSIVKRLYMLLEKTAEEWAKIPGVPLFARYAASPFLYKKLTEIYGMKQGAELCLTLSESAPIAIRTNLMKTDRKQLFEMLQKRFAVSEGALTETAICFFKREPLFSLPEFKDGLFEVQDEGSQKVAELVAALPSQRVLDYCSGSGGKALAIAARMGGKGEIYLSDVRKNALVQAKKRLCRAGVQNAQVLPMDHPTFTKLAGKMDWVLLDVPCSGTGTLRRNPEMKLRIDSLMIQRLVQEQRSIIDKAIRFVKPGGRIVYATCSILPEENEEQILYFAEKQGFVLENKPLKILPSSGGCDGFFAAVFRKEPIR